jgi:RNA polymerase sigma-70 factor (ECF subfamily)
VEPQLQYEARQMVLLLQEGRKDVFEELFRAYFPLLFGFCLKFVRQKQVAEEIVQDVFLYVWQKRHQIEIDKSLQAYLFTATKNKSINYLKLKYNQYQYDDEPLGQIISTHSAASDKVEQEELQNLIDKGIESLPERCRMVFSLSRNAGLTYAEIAQEMAISVKTVEIQMGIALKKLKEFLQAYGFFCWPIIFCFFFAYLANDLGVPTEITAINTRHSVISLSELKEREQQ